jgi:hypothetical protein
MYGHKLTLETGYGSNKTMKVIIQITAQECEAKKFTYKNIERKAFRLHLTADGLTAPRPALVPRNFFIPKAGEDEWLNVYIQSHALHRMAERLDTFDSETRNISMQYITLLEPAVTEKQILFKCIMYGIISGYFTYFIQGDDVVLNTFLPITSEITPEGKKFHELFPLSKDEIIYLGMDKISFLLNFDFEQLPEMKQALIDSNIWETKLMLERELRFNGTDEERRAKMEGITKPVKAYLEKRKTENADNTIQL